MDFFDNAVNKAKEAIDIACKKTNDVVTTQKQKFDVAAVENKRAKDYEKLGMLYFEIVKDTEIEDSQIKALVDAIKEKNEKIKDLKAEINAAKNKRVCPNCAASIDKESVFCNNCGTKLQFDSERDGNE